MPTGHFIRYQSKSDFKPSSVTEPDCSQCNGWNGWRLTRRFKSSTSTTVVRCESVLDSCRRTVIAQRAIPFFNFTVAGTTATIASTTPTRRPIKLKKDLATEKPQTCKQTQSAYLRGCVENLVEIYECEWMHQNKTSTTKRKFVDGLKTVKPRRDLTQEKSSDKCKMENSLACSCVTLKHLKSSNRNSKKSAQFSKTPWFRETTLSSTCVSTPSETTSSRNLAGR